jgi:D-alanyl-D-alanine carboxypeptidase
MNFYLDDADPSWLNDAARSNREPTRGSEPGMGHNGEFRLLTRDLPARINIACLIWVGLLLSVCSASAQVGSARYSAIVVEATSGRIIMGTNQDELRFPASLTKLMTLYMTFEALRDRRIQPGEYVPVSAWAAAQPPSKLGLQPGEAMTVEQAILGLVTKSANDAAAALGEFLGGSEDRFAQMMTLRARALGMSRTSFRNASGLPDPDQWTTARDLATLGRRLVLDFPQLYGYFGVSGFVWHNRVILNHDTMLRSYPGADGMKTGYTDSAGHNLVTSAVRGNVRLIGVVMGAASNSERDQHMAVLLDDGFSQLNAPSRVFGASGFASADASPGMGASMGGRLVALANAAPPPFAFRSMPTPPDMARPAPGSRIEREPRVEHEHGVQLGAYLAEHTAWEIAQEAGRFAPNGEPRAVPVAEGRRTLYHAQILGLSEPEARNVCATLPHRRGPSCQVFRLDLGRTAFR